MLVIQVFVYLQILDFITTLVGFRAGASEASPFIAKIIRISSPVAGLAVSKVAAMAIAGVCLVTHRSRLVGWANYWYAGLIVWNLFIIWSAVNRHPGV